MNSSATFHKTIGTFVRYLNVVEPVYQVFGKLNARVGFASDDDGSIRFWMQDLNIIADDDDLALFDAVYHRVKHLVRDLNRCHSFIDVKINHTYDLYSANDEYKAHLIKGIDWDD